MRLILEISYSETHERKKSDYEIAFVTEKDQGSYITCMTQPDFDL